MKPRLVKLALISSCALMAAQAFAQSAKVSNGVPEPVTAVAANLKGSKPAAAAMSAAAGSAIVLADGIVANATTARIQPPAPGFVYER